MLDDGEFSRWREAAEDALRASRDNAAAGWHNWSCMIAEQAAQLAVKALLHAVGRGDRARGHDLVALLERAADLGGLQIDEELRSAGVRLSRHYQPTRYPDALPGGTPRSRYQREDADEAVADATAVLLAVDAAVARLRATAEQDEP